MTCALQRSGPRAAAVCDVHERQVTIELNPGDPTSLLDLEATYARAGRLAEADSVLAAAPSEYGPLIAAAMRILHETH